MTLITAGVLYFAVVFGMGFLLASLRLFWLVPRVGTRKAKWLELPMMLVVSGLAASWLVERFAVPATLMSRLGLGSFALGLLRVAEFTLGRWLRGLPLQEYLAQRDPVAGTVYYLALAGFAPMPWLVMLI
jgi:hypothetical protein